MGLFEKLFPAKKERIVRNEGSWQTLNAYMPQFVPFTGDLFDNEIIRSAVHVKAEHISKLEVDMQGAALPVMKTRLKNRPNNFQTWPAFLYRCSCLYDIYNNLVIVPILNDVGETIGIYPVLPQSCKIVDWQGEPYLLYRFMNGKQVSIEMSKCAIISKHQLKDDFFGASNCASLNSTMELINLNEQSVKQATKESNTYRFMAKVNNYLLDDDLVKDKKSFVNKQLAGEDGGGLLLFPNNYENIQQINSKPFVADTDAIKNIQENIFNYFNVNEHILQSKATEQEMNNFFDTVIEPFCIKLSEAITRMLFTSKEINMGNRIVFTCNRLQYMTVNSKINLATTLADRGAITIGEIRDLFNFNRFGDERDEMTPVRGEYSNTQTSDRMAGTDDTETEGEEDAV